MAKRILYIALVVVAVAVGWYWWTQRNQASSLNDGSVSSGDTTGGTSKARMDSGAVDIDGRSGNTAIDPYTGIQTPAASQPTTSSATAVPQPVLKTSTPAPAIPYSLPTAVPSSLPTGDTLSPNAPNGMAFGGSGKYQWYRQGNLTWRIDTRNGSSCIAFATMDEWAKPIVYSHGCGRA